MSFRVLPLSNCHTRGTPGCRSLFRQQRIFCPPSSAPQCNVIENCLDAFEVASLQKENTVSVRRYCRTIMIMEIFSRLSVATSVCCNMLQVHRTVLMSFITDYLLIFVDAFWIISTRLEKSWSKWSPPAAAAYQSLTSLSFRYHYFLYQPGIYRTAVAEPWSQQLYVRWRLKQGESARVVRRRGPPAQRALSTTTGHKAPSGFHRAASAISVKDSNPVSADYTATSFRTPLFVRWYEMWLLTAQLRRWLLTVNFVFIL